MKFYNENEDIETLFSNIELVNSLYELIDKTNIDFIFHVTDNYSNLELIYSKK